MAHQNESPAGAGTPNGADEVDLFSQQTNSEIPSIVNRSNSIDGNATKIRARIGGPAGQERTFHGRCAWALDQLVRAGTTGVTPIQAPGPRWSDYIFKLRRAGVEIVTIDEPHSGTYAGRHARYCLACALEILEREAA